MSANDGIKRGDSARTGDLAANTPGKEISRGGSGVRGVDDGSVGQTTGDSSAGGLGSAGDFMELDSAEGIGTAGTGTIDELTVVSEDDPSLGLTAFGDVPADDWAADTGPARNPDRGVVTDDIADTSSTLGPDR
jgi:hypothetical protein